MTTRVAVLGLGRMGLPIARRLAAVADVVGFDVNPERRAAATAHAVALAAGPDAAVARAWAAALTLILIVMVLNLLARLIAKLFAPKMTGR